MLENQHTKIKKLGLYFSVHATELSKPIKPKMFLFIGLKNKDKRVVLVRKDLLNNDYLTEMSIIDYIFKSTKKLNDEFNVMKLIKSITANKKWLPHTKVEFNLSEYEQELERLLNQGYTKYENDMFKDLVLDGEI